MIRLLEDRRKALRHLDTIIIREDLDRQNLLDRRAMIARPAIDALKAVIAADHQQTAASLHVRLDELQSVRGAATVNPGVRMKQKRVGANIGKDDHLINAQIFQSLRK